MASLFTRTYTFTDGTIAYGSQVEFEIATLSTTLNNLNTAATNWGQVSSLHASSVPLVADCSSGSQDIADFKNNSVTKASISSAGIVSSVTDFKSTGAGSGLILTTPDGTKTYRLYIDNNGELTTLELT